jgi:predicted AAA+ superfamily ATPase
LLFVSVLALKDNEKRAEKQICASGLTFFKNVSIFALIFFNFGAINGLIKMKNTYIPRNIDAELLAWKQDDGHKPLLVRGARQVGKSSAVRNLAQSFANAVEVNFDEREDARAIFDTLTSPQEICDRLSLLYDTAIVPGKTLLFFDEIQACPRAISMLRYFYEEYPEIHVVAAGSLLEFALEELPSFGVGRIRSMFVYPFSFGEFLTATGNSILRDAIAKASLDEPFVEPIHNKALSLLKKFLILGGMPEVVAAYAGGRSTRECMGIMDDLLGTYRDDFAKYRRRVPATRIGEVFDSVMRNAGQSFVYTGAANANLGQIKEALELLVMAGLVFPVTHTAANGIPLGAEVNRKKQKMLPLDTGLLQRMLGLDVSEILLSDDFEVINKGALAEIYVGLEILKSTSGRRHEDLYFWKREERGSHAEVDYLIQKNENIIPIEVKSGTRGSMQSLQLFLAEKNRPFGVRTSSENFASYNNIRVVPLYAVGNIRE